MKQNEILMISCGGTGGHFNPGLAIARRCQELGGIPVLVLGGIHAEKQIKSAQQYGIAAMPVSSAPLSKNPFKMIKFFLKTAVGFFQCRKAFRKAKPKALLAMGSFASLPPVFAAWTMRIPIFLHDGNARIGKSNRVLSRFAKAVALSFPAVNANACHVPCIQTGMPLRPELINATRSKQQAVEEINQKWNCDFSPEKPIVLVFGGSLGAASINTKLHALPGMKGLAEIQFIRLSGPGKLDELNALTKDSPAKHLNLEGYPEIGLFYSAADVIVCRSGGSTVSELAIYGKYALLVPFPFAAEGHQDDNARWLAAAGGAEIMKDSECSPERFTEFLERFLANRAKYEKLGRKSATLAVPDAADKVIDMIDNITGIQSERIP